jgi:hypothetical protein
MQRIIPRALLACISEARTPQPCEIECVAEKVLREAFGGSAEERVQQLARRVANVALRGHCIAA